MPKQPAGLARARAARAQAQLEERKVAALERIADALEALQIVPLPARVERVAIRVPRRRAADAG